MKSHADKAFLGTRELLEDGSRGEYKFKTYTEILDITSRLGSGVINLDLAPLVSDYKDISIRPLCIYSKNREEWIDLDLTASLFGFTVIPIYDTLGMDSVEFIFKQTNASTCFCSSYYLSNLLKSISKHKTLGGLVNLIALDKITAEQ